MLIFSRSVTCDGEQDTTESLQDSVVFHNRLMMYWQVSPSQLSTFRGSHREGEVYCLEDGLRHR
jgi:hypothetical protein